MTALTVEDRAAVLDLLARAAWAADERRLDDFAAHFTSSAVLERRHRSGPPSRWSAADGSLPDFIAAERAGVHVEDLQTWTSDAILTARADGVEVVSTSLRIGSASGGTANVLLADAEVRDLVVRTPEGWRIAARRVTPLGVEDDDPLPLADPGGEPPAASGSQWRDRLEIEALFADYAWALDTADLDGVAALFSDDAIMQDPFGRFTGSGPDGFRRFFEGLFARPEFAGRIHWVSQLVLTPLDEGYRVDSYALVPASFGTGAVNLHLLAFYRDVVVRERGRWRFRERLVGPRWERLDD